MGVYIKGMHEHEMAQIDSICDECVSRCYIPERIAIDPADSYPAEEWCEEDSDNFQTEDGCYRFERRKRKNETDL